MYVNWKNRKEKTLWILSGAFFAMDVAEVYEQEGIDTFREYLKQENIDPAL